MKLTSIIVAFVAVAPQAADAASLIRRRISQEKGGKTLGRGTKNNLPSPERKRTNLRHDRHLEEEMSIAHVEEDTTLDAKSDKLAPAEFSMPERCRLTEELSMPTEQLEFSMPGRRVEEDITFGHRVTEDMSMPIEQLEFSMP